VIGAERTSLDLPPYPAGRELTNSDIGPAAHEMYRKPVRAIFATTKSFWQQEEKPCHRALMKMALAGATCFAVAARWFSAA
jgi:hypothetical protein